MTRLFDFLMLVSNFKEPVDDQAIVREFAGGLFDREFELAHFFEESRLTERFLLVTDLWPIRRAVRDGSSQSSKDSFLSSTCA